jgi:serine/threonine protein kinase
MVTGKTPFQGENAFVVMNSRLSGDPVAPRKIRPEISPVLEEIILHAMERDSENRYHSVTGFQSDLDHQDLVRLTGRAERLRPPKLWEVEWRRYRVVALAIAFILLVFGLIYVIAHGEKGTPRPKGIPGR